MPWRSASGSQATATSNWSLYSIRPLITYGDEQSIRILPSWSSGTNRNVGSTSSLTTSRLSWWRSAMALKYATDAPPSGCAPMWTFASRMASMSITLGRSSTYADT